VRHWLVDRRIPIRESYRSPLFLRCSINRRLAPALIAALGCAILAGCKPPNAGQRQRQWNKGGDKAVKEQRLFLSPAVVQTIRRQDLVSTVSATGTALPYQSVMLRAEEPGRLRFEKRWLEGDPVRKGEIIARIESESLAKDIELAQRDVEIQRENVEIGRRSMDSAIREHKTLQDLYSRGIAARRQVDEAELAMHRAVNTHRQNLLQLEKAEATLRTIKARVERTTVRAPFDGLLVSPGVLQGTASFAKSFGTETITTSEGRTIGNEFAIAGVVDPSRMIVRCDVTSRDIERIREGQTASITFLSTEDIVVEGTVQAISRAVNSETRAFSVDILVDNAQGLLKPGMFGRADVVVERRLRTISIPKSVVTRRNNRSVVFVAVRPLESPHALAEERPVELGLEGRDHVEVLSGLNEGDEVVIRGFEVLQDKTPINALNAEGPPPRAGTATAEATPAPPMG
jgi:multidrug efflux pump subunit AcrA (membrane-fusion protein)